jgi:WD40 repeat protein
MTRPFWLTLLVLALTVSCPVLYAEPSGKGNKLRRDQAGDPLPAGALARMGTVRWLHGGSITALAFSGDGKQIVSASRDGTARLWDSSSGKEIRRFTGHRGEVRCLALSGDGKTLATGGSDGTARLWDVATAKEQETVVKATQWINALAFSPKGDLLAVAADNGSIRLWDVSARRPAGKFTAETSVTGIAFVGDGLLAAAGAADAGLSLWQTDGRKVRKIAGWAHGFAPSPDRKTIAIADYNTPTALYSVTDGKKLLSLAETGEARPRVACLNWSPGGKSIVGACSGGEVRIWDAATGKLRQTLQGHSGDVRAVAFSPDGKWIVSGGEDRTILIWDAATGKRLHRQPGHVGAITAALSPNGKTLATAGQDGSLRLWDAGTGKEKARIASASPLECLSYSPDGKLLATGDRQGVIALRDPSTGKMRRSLNGHGRAITGLAFTVDGKSLVSGSRDRTVRAWDLSTGKVVQTVSAQGRGAMGAFSLSPDGKKVLIVPRAAALRMLDLSGSTESGRFPGHVGGCLAVAFSPTGHLAASGGREMMVRIWEVVSGKERRALSGFPGWGTAVAWSPDGLLLASGHGDGQVRLWDPFTGKEWQALAAHEGAVTSLSFSADGKRLASAGEGGTALIWDVPALVQAGRTEVVRLSAQELEKLWRDLASANAPEAAAAVQILARAHPQAVALFRDRVRPVTREELKQLIADLDSPRFAEREKATNRLSRLGRFAELALRQTIKEQPSLEVRARVEIILSRLESGNRAPEEIQALRALEVLEMIGTPRAHQVLKSLAGGAPECELTREARAALERLSRRPKKP